MARFVKVTEGKFKAIKILLASGETQKVIAETMGVSVQVVGYIKNSETYEEYKHKIYLTSGAYRKKCKAEAEFKQKQEDEKLKQEQQKLITAVPDQITQPPVQVVEHRQTVTVQASHFMLEEQRQTNELLKSISNKLAFIVMELTGKKEEMSDE